MLTDLPEDETILFHPIVFFDQGTYFFETRRRLDGEALLQRGLRGSSGDLRKRTEADGHLVMDPIEPLRRLDAVWIPPTRPGDPRQGNPDLDGKCEVHCSAIIPESWGLLAMLGSEEIERVRSAVGGLPARPAGFGEEEWLLRHAFSDERVRDNSLLAAMLARLPILFARAHVGAITFRPPRCTCGRRLLDSHCRLVVIVETGSDLQEDLT